MAKTLPLIIEKIFKKTEYKNEIETLFLVSIKDKNSDWSKTLLANREQIENLRNKLNILLDDLSIAEKLNISEEDGKKLSDTYAKDSNCQTCSYKESIICKTCFFTTQSPLERIMFRYLKEGGIYKFENQVALDFKGEVIYPIQSNSGDIPYDQAVLTVADFFLKYDKICIYVDGHTYHERTEEQATHDRNIDRKLQGLGYTVYRYTGKEIRENPKKIINDLQTDISKKSYRR